MARVNDAQLDELAAWERKQSRPWFSRTCVRASKWKRRLDCGHQVDGSVKMRDERYVYMVWKDRGAESIEQRTCCEVCARVAS